MQAVRFYQYGGSDVLFFELDVPEPAVGPGEVLVELVATSVNPIDWKVRSGARQKDFPQQLPAIPGRDVSGIVREVGRDIRHFRPGDRVVGMANATYAQFVSVPGEALAHLPDGVDAVDAAAIPLVALTGDQLVRLTARVTGGETVLVSGALGSVGRAAVHAAKKLGARVIAGVRANRLAEAASLDVFKAVAIDDDAAVASLEPLDAVADTVGGETARRLFGRVRDGGRFGFASVLPADLAATNPAVEVSRVFARPDAATVRAFADDIRDEIFTLPVSQRLPLRQAATAHDLMEKGGAGKIILVPETGQPEIARP